MQFPILSLLTSLLFFTVSTSADATLPTTVTIAYAPLTPSTAKPSTPKAFATLSYHATNNTYTIKSTTPPKPSSSKSDSLVRIGIIPHSKSQLQIDGFAAPSTTIAEQSILSSLETAVLRIVLDVEGAVISAGVSKDYSLSTDVKAKRKAGWPSLEIVPSAPEPKPVLNKPVVLGEDGKLPAQEKPEPTLFQKYWWIAALVLLFTFVGGGGGEEGGK